MILRAPLFTEKLTAGRRELGTLLHVGSAPTAPSPKCDTVHVEEEVVHLDRCVERSSHESDGAVLRGGRDNFVDMLRLRRGADDYCRSAPGLRVFNYVCGARVNILSSAHGQGEVALGRSRGNSDDLNIQGQFLYGGRDHENKTLRPIFEAN